MKHTFLILLVFAITLSSCDDAETTPTITTQRITIKESTLPSNFRYEIIEVNGVEYLCSSRGGICPLVKDTTAKKIIFKINQ
jgi:hypothetical protein